MAFPTGWGRKCALTIDKTKVGSDVSGYPILLGYNLVGAEANFPAEMLDSNDSNKALSDGGDIRFSSDVDGVTQLPCQIEIWTQNATAGNRKAKVWVKASVSSSSDTTIYVWYKKSGESQPSVTDTYGRNATWSSYNNVWHLGESSTPNVDSKGGCDGVWGGTGTSQQDGKMGKSNDFNSGAGYATVNGATGYNSSTAHTYEVWLYPTANNDNQNVFYKNAHDWGDAETNLGDSPTAWSTKNPGYGVGLTKGCVDGGWRPGSTRNISQNVWHHFVVNFISSSDGKFYYDGSDITGTLWKQFDYTFNAYTGSKQRIGSSYPLTPSTFAYVGRMQELRSRTGSSTSGWILTCYNNMNDPSTFIKTVGTPVDVTGDMTVTVSVLSSTVSIISPSVFIGVVISITAINLALALYNSIESTSVTFVDTAHDMDFTIPTPIYGLGKDVAITVMSLTSALYDPLFSSDVLFQPAIFNMLLSLSGAETSRSFIRYNSAGHYLSIYIEGVEALRICNDGTIKAKGSFSGSSI